MTTKRLYRSRDDQMLGGVCAGVAEYFDVDPTLVRLVFAALTLFGVGSPVLVYLLLWLIMPEAPASAMPQYDSPPQAEQPRPMVDYNPVTGTNHAEPKMKEPLA